MYSCIHIPQVILYHDFLHMAPHTWVSASPVPAIPSHTPPSPVPATPHTLHHFTVFTLPLTHFTTSLSPLSPSHTSPRHCLHSPPHTLHHVTVSILPLTHFTSLSSLSHTIIISIHHPPSQSLTTLTPHHPHATPPSHLTMLIPHHPLTSPPSLLTTPHLTTLTPHHPLTSPPSLLTTPSPHHPHTSPPPSSHHPHTSPPPSSHHPHSSPPSHLTSCTLSPSQESETSYVYQVTSSGLDGKDFSSFIEVPRTRLRKLSANFVFWKDEGQESVWGLNFSSERDTLRFLAGCTVSTHVHLTCE